MLIVFSRVHIVTNKDVGFKVKFYNSTHLIYIKTGPKKIHTAVVINILMQTWGFREVKANCPNLHRLYVSGCSPNSNVLASLPNMFSYPYIVWHFYLSLSPLTHGILTVLEL